MIHADALTDDLSSVVQIAFVVLLSAAILIALVVVGLRKSGGGK